MASASVYRYCEALKKSGSGIDSIIFAKFQAISSEYARLPYFARKYQIVGLHMNCLSGVFSGLQLILKHGQKENNSEQENYRSAALFTYTTFPDHHTTLAITLV